MEQLQIIWNQKLWSIYRIEGSSYKIDTIFTRFKAKLEFKQIVIKVVSKTDYCIW